MNPLLLAIYALTGFIGFIWAIYPYARDARAHVTRRADSTFVSALLRLCYLTLVGLGLYAGANALSERPALTALVWLVAGSIAGVLLGCLIALIRRAHYRLDRSGKRLRAEMARQLRGTTDAPLGFAIERRLAVGMHPSVAIVCAMAEQMHAAAQALPEGTVERDTARASASALQIAADAATRAENLRPEYQTDSGRLAAVVTNAVADSGLRDPL